MSHTTHTTMPRTRATRRARQRVVRRRRWVGGLLALAAVAVLVPLVSPLFNHAVEEIALPLRHEDIIRQQARDKNLDPALIAAVIYAESRFVENRTSAAGALGLMQVTPATAADIARKSGGVAFTTADLATPQVNIAYGAYQLRHLLNRFDGDEAAALAGYNAGPGKAAEWGGSGLTVASIPYPETKAYVQRVLAIREQYRRKYAPELGL
jgi:soluble lytic murein transglycosylase